jgi:FkbM family methyltransferase
MKQFVDFQRYLPSFGCHTIFDVGANIGQSTAAYRQQFPNSRVFSFEPVAKSFESLVAAVGNDKDVKCFNLALGDKEASATIQAQGTNTMNRIVEGPISPKIPVEQIQVSTGDRFCEAAQIDRIDFLKIDTEGFDLRVCRGFVLMLVGQRIGLLQVEAGMHPGNSVHVPFESFKNFLQPLGYSIFKLYDQVLESRAPRLRRANVVFISDELVDQNTRLKNSAAK